MSLIETLHILCRVVLLMKKVSFSWSKYSIGKGGRSRILFPTCMLLLIVSVAVIVPSVLAQINLDVDADYEFSFDVTSTTALWTPGTHSFNVTGAGNVSAPFADTFTMNGSGTAEYSMVGGGYPPGEFDLTLEMSGFIDDSLLTGPYTMSVVAHAETMQVADTPGYVRTEEVMNVAINGTFNDLPWNATSTSTTVDFSYIGPEGTEFQIQVTGSSHVIPEFPSAIVTPVILIAVTLIAAVITGAYSKKGRPSKH